MRVVAVVRSRMEKAAMSELDEDQAIAQVVDRLAAQFPSLARERVQLVVDEERERLAPGRVRDFVPVLVEHEAKERLRGEAQQVHVPAGTGDVSRVPDDPVELDPMEVERNSRRSESGFLFGDLGGGPS